jgi:HSP20 family protein
MQANSNTYPATGQANSNQTTTTTHSSLPSTSWTPEDIPQLTVDVYRDDDTIFVVSTVAGISPKDIDISVDNNILSIKGIRHKPYEDKKNTLLLEECFWGEFHRELTINENLNVDKIRANINQGILTIAIPILRVSNSKRIKVDVAI